MVGWWVGVLMRSLRAVSGQGNTYAFLGVVAIAVVKGCCIRDYPSCPSPRACYFKMAQQVIGLLL